MKKIGTFIIISILLSGCLPRKTIIRDYYNELYIDYQFISFQGKNESQHLKFYIDSISKRDRFYGKLIINVNDTFLLEGFKKGSTRHPCFVHDSTNSIIFIDNRFQEPYRIIDSLTIESHTENDTHLILETTILHRQIK
jgi:hypothetical protein